MGLDVSHDCFHGAYSAYYSLRQEWAKAAGLPPLSLMEGFYENPETEHVFMSPFTLTYLESKAYVLAGNREMTQSYRAIKREVLDYLPIQWRCLRPSPLFMLLRHSDCEGFIEAKYCASIAGSLEKLLPSLPDGGTNGHIWDWKEVTQKWIDGLRLAAKKKQKVTFR